MALTDDIRPDRPRRDRLATALIVAGLAGLVVAAGIAAAVPVLLKPQTARDAVAGEQVQMVTVAGTQLSVPRRLLARRTAPAGTLDLVVPLDDRPGSRLDRVALIRLQPADGATDPAERTTTLYARFLTSDVWTNPGGLISRRFRDKSPFENEELYIAPPDGRRFAARCPRLDRPDAVAGLCLAEFRRGGIDVVVSFSPRRLPDWTLVERRIEETLAAILPDAG